jgi:hypothetical protein
MATKTKALPGTKALSGASQDAYFRRVLKAHPSLSAEDRDRLVGHLRQDIAQLRLRTAVPNDVVPRDTDPKNADPKNAASKEAEAAPPPSLTTPTPALAAAPFDPFSPNVIVVVRKSGRDAALSALGAIDNVDHLRLLAREQRLSLPAGLSSQSELRTAIVAAAERRIANRMAAAS